MYYILCNNKIEFWLFQLNLQLKILIIPEPGTIYSNLKNSGMYPQGQRVRLRSHLNFRNSDTLTLFQPGVADSAHHRGGRTKKFPMDTSLQNALQTAQYVQGK